MLSLNIYPEIIKWRPNKQGLVSIVIRFDFDGQPVIREPLKQRIKISEWNKDERKIKASHPQSAFINQIIENRINHHRNYFLRRQTFNLPVTKELIKQYIKSGSTLESFYHYAETVIETKKLKDGYGYSEETKRCYRDEIKRLMKFKSELSFTNLNAKFLNDYKTWLQTVYLKKNNRHLDNNSVWKALKFVRMIYNEAVNNNIILSDDNPFKNFEVGGYQVHEERIKFLQVSDLEIIENILRSRKEQLSELTYRIGLRFLAMCVCGMRISDAMYLNDASFNDAGDIEFTPYKTRRHNNKAQVPVVSERQKKYLSQTIAAPLPQTDHKSFRTTFNIHLKILAAMAGITINLTSHVGRHTMGSLLVDAGVEDKSAMAMLGVKSDKVLKTYLHLKQSKLHKEAEKLRNVF
jgi:site-specific recombinase XerD